MMNEVTDVILADKIIEQRKKNGWSQEELAQHIGVSRQAVSKWEGAQSVPDLDKVLLLGKAFGVSTDYLLKDDIEKADPAVFDGDADEEAPMRRVTMEEAGAYLTIRQTAAKRIALACMMCVLSPICLLLLGAASTLPDAQITEGFAIAVGMIALLALVAGAVAIMISCGAQSSRFEYLEKEAFETEYGVTGMVKERKKQFSDRYTRANIIGCCICILAVIPLFVGASISEGLMLLVSMLCLMLALLGVGVTVFVRAGVVWASMQKLLQEGEFTKRNKKHSPLISAVSTAYWLLVTAGYVGYGLVTNDWKNSWPVWPIAGILYAAINVVLNAWSERQR